MSLTLEFFVVLVYLVTYSSHGQILDAVNCIFKNRKISPVNIDETSALQIHADLLLNPDPLGKYNFTMEKNEKDGVLHILPDFPSNNRPTLEMKYLKHKFHLQDIHLFWGEVSYPTATEITIPQTTPGSGSTTSTTTKKIIAFRSSPTSPAPELTVLDGSEHSVNKRFFPIEVRMVYVPAEKSGNIFGLNVKTVVKTHFLKVKPTDSSSGMANKKLTIVDIIPPAATAVDRVNYVAYKGSLTTTPHNKDVLWIVSTTPGSIDQNAFQLLYSKYPDLHNRKRAPIQHLCGRKMYKLIQGTPFAS